jgi:RNA ligase
MLDFVAIRREIDSGYISEQRHPQAPIRILNYTHRAQYDWRWNPETMQCRGLIVDDNNRIVARPFAKFFTYEQLSGVVPNEPFEAYEKLDGSLGILYMVDGEPCIATRGSFVSDQAERATEIYRRKYRDIVLDDRMTYLFEIIYPGNRIVVNYGGCRPSRRYRDRNWDRAATTNHRTSNC